MRRNIDGTCSPSCCSNPNIRTINTMSADTQGNFTIRGDMGIHVTVGTNEVIISGIVTYYDNTDGNIVIDNDLLTINLADDITITGDMIIAGDLTVNGTYYTVHAEHVNTEDDYIIMRDGAVTGLGSGDYSGFQVKLYDGVNDGRLVIDNTGTARVGDVGDEQPLLTREEAANLNDGALLKWDAANSKAVDEGTVGDDTHPVKIVNGVAAAVTNELQTKLTPTQIYDDSTLRILRYGQMVVVSLNGYTPPTTGARNILTGLPTAYSYCVAAMVNASMTVQAAMYMQAGTGILVANCASVNTYYGEMVYITNDP